MNASTAICGLPSILNASLLNAPPEVDVEGVQRFVKLHYGIVGHVQPLSGERDRTFHISGQKGIDYVFKVAHPDEDPEITNFQIEVLLFLATTASWLPTQRVIPCLDGGMRRALLYPAAIHQAPDLCPLFQVNCFAFLSAAQNSDAMSGGYALSWRLRYESSITQQQDKSWRGT